MFFLVVLVIEIFVYIVLYNVFIIERFSLKLFLDVLEVFFC